MPTLELTESELQNAAQACRIARQLSIADAEKQGNPSTHLIFDESARRFEALAAKFEHARKQRTSM